MAAGASPAAVVDKLGRDLGAHSDCDRTALDEPAAGGGVDGGRGAVPCADRTCSPPRRRVRHGGEEQAGVRVERALQDLFARPVLDDLAGVHHEHVVGDVARAREIVRDVEEGEAGFSLSSRSGSGCRSGSRRRASSRLVGEHHRGSTASARAIATRCRCPPDSSCGYFAAISLGRHQANRPSSSCTRAVDLRARRQAVDLERPRDVVADRLDRVQRAEGVLEDHLHLRAVAQDVAPPPSRATSLPSKMTLPAVGGTGARAGARRCSCRCRSRRRAP